MGSPRNHVTCRGQPATGETALAGYAPRVGGTPQWRDQENSLAHETAFLPFPASGRLPDVGPPPIRSWAFCNLGTAPSLSRGSCSKALSALSLTDRKVTISHG